MTFPTIAARCGLFLLVFRTVAGEHFTLVSESRDLALAPAGVVQAGVGLRVERYTGADEQLWTITPRAEAKTASPRSWAGSPWLAGLAGLSWRRPTPIPPRDGLCRDEAGNLHRRHPPAQLPGRPRPRRGLGLCARPCGRPLHEQRAAALLVHKVGWPQRPVHVGVGTWTIGNFADRSFHANATVQDAMLRFGGGCATEGPGGSTPPEFAAGYENLDTLLAWVRDHSFKSVKLNGGKVGIVFRAQDANNYYCWQFGDGALDGTKVVDGQVTVLKAGVKTTLTQGGRRPTCRSNSSARRSTPG